MTSILPSAELQRDPVRDRLHDLRNLFGVVASGTHLLSDPIAPERQHMVLDAMDRAAARGSEILSALLAGPEAQMSTLCRLPERLTRLEPILSTMAGDAVGLNIDVATRSALTFCVPEQFDRVVLELVANARRALPESGRIMVRLRCMQDQVWLIVADAGVGMTTSGVACALGHLPVRRAAEHGTGMGQVRAFAQSAGGALRIRSRRGKGTVIALVLPAIVASNPGYGESTILALRYTQ